MRKTNSVTIKYYIFIAFASGVLIGCISTEGIIEIKGKVLDECTSTQIPGRDIIVQGLVESNNNLVPVNTAQFTTDSNGCFTYALRKIKDAHYYNFCLVGDSDYASITKEITLGRPGKKCKVFILLLKQIGRFNDKYIQKK